MLGDDALHEREPGAGAREIVLGMQAPENAEQPVVVPHVEAYPVVLHAVSLFRDRARAAHLDGGPLALAGELERTSLGMETINGQQTEKFQVTYTEDKKTMSVYQWIKDGQIPVKVEAVDGSWSMEYQNLKVGPPPADLFEPPAGYEKMAMPSMGDLMKGIMR